MNNKNKYLLVDASVAPEVFTKVVEIKNLLGKGQRITVNEAAKIVGISRSAFYKYKDFVFPFYETSMGRVITLYFVVEDCAGVLSSIIKIIADSNANILTINQNIPINGVADVTISVETRSMNMEIDDLLERIKEIAGVKRLGIVARD